MSNFDEKYNEYKSYIESSINKFISEPEFKEKTVYDAMLYALTNGGKRIRPILTLEFCRLCCGDYERALPFAAAVEMIHCYSLVHDDLPCMDDDDLRRGKPSTHIAFGEANALLAGDGLLTLAFETILERYDKCKISESSVIKAASSLSKLAGYSGMIGGQTIDIASNGKALDVESLKQLHSLKTGALIKCACGMGCFAGSGSKEQIEAAEKYAENIGLSFQIIDDVLDCVGNSEELGKTVGKDSMQEKTTFATLLGVKESVNYASELTEEAKRNLEIFGQESQFLSLLADKLVNRKK